MYEKGLTLDSTNSSLLSGLQEAKAKVAPAPAPGAGGMADLMGMCAGGPTAVLIAFQGTEHDARPRRDGKSAEHDGGGILSLHTG